MQPTNFIIVRQDNTTKLKRQSTIEQNWRKATCVCVCACMFLLSQDFTFHAKIWDYLIDLWGELFLWHAIHVSCVESLPTANRKDTEGIAKVNP